VKEANLQLIMAGVLGGGGGSQATVLALVELNMPA
jgi:hypothetical protein